MTEEYASARYDEACALLPSRLRLVASEVGKELKIQTEELRLRVGRPLFLTLPEGTLPLPQTRVIRSDLEQILDRITEYSRYTASETICSGYITAEGGFRVGICGTALPCDGKNQGIKEVSSLAIRIPRVCEGAARPILSQLFEGGVLASTLIISSPGGGKTTLLRDLVRLVSQGTELAPPLRVSLVDERGEIAAVYRGRPQLEVGCNTDVMDGCPKSLAVPILLRAMNPQVIALDELAVQADVEAVCAAYNCGVSLLATVHASSVPEMRSRPVFRDLLNCHVFQRAVLIDGQGGKRSYRVEVL